MNKKYDLEDRLVEFAAKIILFIKALPKDTVGQYYGGQLLRSSGSAALNFGEAQGTKTNKDYISKASIALKELKETRVNLKILTKAKYGFRSRQNMFRWGLACCVSSDRISEMGGNIGLGARRIFGR